MNIRGLRKALEGMSSAKLNRLFQLHGYTNLANIENGRGSLEGLREFLLQTQIDPPSYISEETIRSVFKRCFPHLYYTTKKEAFNALLQMAAESTNQKEEDDSFPSDSLSAVSEFILYVEPRLIRYFKYGRFLPYNESLVDGSYSDIAISIINETSAYTISEYTSNVFLSGIGGSGKTFFILDQIRKLLDNKEKSVVPIYIPLKELIFDSGQVNLTEWISNHYFPVQQEKSCSMVTRMLSTCPTVLFADGLNEISDQDNRDSLITEIARIVGDYPLLKLVISSRRDDTLALECKGCNCYKVQIGELTPNQIKEYLHKKRSSICFDSLSTQTKSIIKTAQGLAMLVSMEKENDKSKNYSNLAELLLAYCRRMYHDDEKTPIPFEKEIEQVAYTMTMAGRFTIDAFTLEQYIDLRGVHQIANVISNDGYGENLNLFSTQTDYSFYHQNIRDMFAAKYFARLISTTRNLSDVIKRSPITENKDILEMVASFLTRSTLDEIISMQNDPYILGILIFLYSRTDNGNLSHLRLYGKDLSSVSLSGFSLYQRETESDCDFVKLSNCTIGYDTFLPQGLEGSCSEIAHYRLTSGEYLAFFSKSNIIVYNIETHTIQSVHGLGYTNEGGNFMDFGWVRCLCPLTIDNELCFVFGTRSGHLLRFYPQRTKSTIAQSFTLDGRLSLASSKYIAHNGGANIVEFCFDKPFRYTYNGIDSVIGIHDASESGIAYIIQYNAVKEELSNKLIGAEYWCLMYNNIEILRGNNKKNIGLNQLTKSEKGLYILADNKIWYSFFPLCGEDTKFTLLYDGSNESDNMYDIIYHHGFLFVNQTLSIRVFIPHYREGSITLEEIASDALEGGQADSLQSFLSFNPCEEECSVITGVKAKNNDFTKIANLYKFTLKHKRGQYTLTHIPISGEHHVTVHAGIEYRTSDGEKHIASVADDRTIQILTPYNENVSPRRIWGNYNGIHYVTAFENYVLTANYDGTVSRWICQNERLYCMDTYPIHKAWVWRVQYLDSEHIISCSYDGTLIITHIINYSRYIIFSNSKPILDFACHYENGGFRIIAISKEEVLVGFATIRDDHLEIKEESRIIDNYNSYGGNRCIIYDPNCGAFLCQNSPEGTAICSLSNSIINKPSISLADRYIQCMKYITLDEKQYIVIAGNIKRKIERSIGSGYIGRSKAIDEEHIVSNECGYLAVLEIHDNEIQLIKEYFEPDPKTTEEELNLLGTVNSVKVKNVVMGTQSVILFQVIYNEMICIMQFDGEHLVDFEERSITVSNASMLDSDWIDEKDATLFVVGELSGRLSLVNAKSKQFLSRLQHHANLIANEDVELDNCLLPDDFKRSFNGYFDITE